MFGRFLLLSLLALPLVEIALFIVIGQTIGLVPTLLGVLLTAVIGGLVLRWQGMAAVNEMRLRMSRGELPARAMGDTMLIGLAGVLLLLPGYFTDLIGILLLLPWTRELIYRLLARNFRVVEVAPGSYRNTQPDLIELDQDDWRTR
ncbi:MAG: FxsA family protein [Hyphomicrobiales bacterium]|nr:MAG: FxsA family protein [Hyphomicrobiales bacterium]